MTQKFAALLAVFLLTQTANTAKSATTYIAVTTTIYNDNALPNDLLFRSDGAMSADYLDGGGKVRSITSQVTPTGGWQLYIGNQTARRVWLTLSHPLQGSPSSPAPDNYYSDSVEVYSRCWDVTNTEVAFTAIPAGTSMNRCSFGVDFAYNRVKYKLVMGPSIPGLAVNTSGTGLATVSCNSANGGVCNSWSIIPNTIAGGENVPTVANLYQFGRSGSLSLIGQYYNTYRVDVTNP